MLAASRQHLSVVLHMIDKIHGRPPARPKLTLWEASYRLDG